LDATYQVLVNGINGDVTIQDTDVNFTIVTKGSRIQDFLKIIEQDHSSVAGK
jgi:hypothetical protein